MGALVKTAQAVEDRAELIRKELESRVQSTLQEARAEWDELKGTKRHISGTQPRLRTLLLRADAALRMELDRLIRRLILELEKVRQALPERGNQF
jgi:hypothetical protein